MMTTINGQRVPIVPRQLSTGQWIAERSPTCFALAATPELALVALAAWESQRPFNEMEVPLSARPIIYAGARVGKSQTVASWLAAKQS